MKIWRRKVRSYNLVPSCPRRVLECDVTHQADWEDSPFKSHAIALFASLDPPGSLNRQAPIAKRAKRLWGHARPQASTRAFFTR